MASDDLADFLDQHTVTVQTFVGVFGSGVRSYASPVAVPCWLERKQEFVRAANGEESMSSASVTVDPAYADVLKLESLVTIPGEPQATVMQRSVADGGTIITGLDHVTVWLK